MLSNCDAGEDSRESLVPSPSMKMLNPETAKESDMPEPLNNSIAQLYAKLSCVQRVHACSVASVVSDSL